MVTVTGLLVLVGLVIGFAHLEPRQVLRYVLLWWLIPAAGVMASFAFWMSFTSRSRTITKYHLVVQAMASVGVTLAIAVVLARIVNDSSSLTQYHDPVNNVLPLVATTMLAGDFWVSDRVKRMFQLVAPHGSPSELQDSIRAVFNDPSLLLWLQFGDEQRFVDVDGREVPQSEFDAARTRLVPADGPAIAAIHWSRAAATRPANTEALLGVAVLAIEKAQLQVRVLSQLNDLVASRRRLVDATDRARQGVERDLHDGAQQRLAALVLALRMAANGAQSVEARTLAERTADDLMAAVSELQDLARGIHPSALTVSGLRAAIEGLAERTPFPTRVDVIDERFPEPIELTAYYVVAESLANVAKHADADSVDVQIRRWGDTLSIVVADDGRGGVDPDAGSGLTGLADRVGALGGTMDIRSEPDAGTSINVGLPVGDPSRQETR